MKAKDLALMALFVVLIIVGTFIRIPLPLCPVNLQPFFVMLSGMLLGRKRGALSVVGYILLGLVGIPVFTNGGGIGYVLQPTFGFMLGYVLAAFIIGSISSSGKATVLRFTMAGAGGLAAVYAIGLAYYLLISKLYLQIEAEIMTILVNCFFLPLPKDIISAVLAAILAKRLLPLVNTTHTKSLKENKNDRSA